MALKGQLLKPLELYAEGTSRLSSIQGLGNSKPSELMNRILGLLGGVQA